MAVWLAVALYVVAILVVVLIHEAGHFFTAKAFKIKVEQFFVGFGPRLWSIRRGETEYGVKALPLGGYVRIAGMNPFEEIPPEELPRTFGVKPAWQRSLVILAGPFTHFAIAILILAGYFSVIGVPKYRPLIDQVCAVNPRSPNPCPSTGRPSPAQIAGFKPGDVIIAVDGHRDISDQALHDYIQGRVGQPLTVVVDRHGSLITLHPVPEPVVEDGQRIGRVGVTIVSGPLLVRERTLLPTAMGRSVVELWHTAKAVVLELGHVFGPSGIKRVFQVLAGSRARTVQDPGSLVAGGQLVAQAAKQGAWDALVGILFAFNVFIGIVNLLPVPPLDGGHLAVIAYEKIRGRRPDARKLLPLAAAVGTFLIFFSVVLIYLDIVHPIPFQP